MARAFLAASSEYLINTSPPITAAPLTMFAWGRDSNTAGVPILVGNSANPGTNIFALEMQGDVGGDPVRVVSLSATVIVDTTTGYSSNTWHAATGRFVSTTSRDVYIDGGSKGSNGASSSTPSGLNNITIGALIRSTSIFSDCDVSHAAQWDVSGGLRETEDIEPLARGVNPFVVQHESLQFYAPLQGDLSPEPDYAGQLSMTLNGTPTKSTTNPPVELLENYL